MQLKMKNQIRNSCWLVLCVAALISCSDEKKQVRTAKENYQVHCGSCHVSPDITDIPKSVWATNILPEMAGRMGFRYNNFDPTKGKSFDEKFLILKSKIYPTRPIIDSLTWWQLHDYIITLAPDSIPLGTKENTLPLTIFKPHPIQLEKVSNPLITSVSFDSISNSFFIGNGNGNLHQWSLSQNKLVDSYSSPIVSYLKTADQVIATEIGLMNPSEISEGTVLSKKENAISMVSTGLHRPVYTELTHLNNDGVKEIIVCEFGHLTGELALFKETPSGYEKTSLLKLPGAVKVEIEDLNNDGKKDIIVLMSQGNEGVFVMYQTEDLKFETKQVISLQPQYGSSWFELIDYNADGHKDIILVNGDNADYSIFAKPYHGVRLFLNDSQNQFEQKWFYPISGATKIISSDFDNDGDLDFVVSAFFAEVGNNNNEGFHFLENKNSENYEFQEYTFDFPVLGNWLAMDKGDVDNDGDLDIVIGSFKLPSQDRRADFKKMKVTKLWWLENQTVQ